MILSKHFVSQKYGRAIAMVDLSSDQATVLIALTELGEQRRYLFSTQEFARHVDREAIPERALRIAITQTHRQTMPRTANMTMLTPDMPVWIGDFSDQAAAAGTRGAPRPGSSTQERRTDTALHAASIERGVQICSLQGRQAAKVFLAGASVPPSVIRRVLSSSRARRARDGLPTAPSDSKA